MQFTEAELKDKGHDEDEAGDGTPLRRLDARDMKENPRQVLLFSCLSHPFAAFVLMLSLSLCPRALDAVGHPEVHPRGFFL